MRGIGLRAYIQRSRYPIRYYYASTIKHEMKKKAMLTLRQQKMATGCLDRRGYGEDR
jgi:hypothetical protein